MALILEGNTAMASEYREMVQALAPKPREIDSWEAMEKPDEMKRVLALPPKDFGPVEFSLVLGGGIEGLYYLPYALKYLRQAKPENRGLCQEVVGFIGRHAPQLMQMGLYSATVKQLLIIFDAWASAYVVSKRPPAGETASHGETIRGSTCMCEFLSAIRMHKLAWRSIELFDYIVQKWAGEPRDPVHSALLLDVLLRAKDPENLSYELHAAPEVLAVANNKTLCQAHWQLARFLIQDHCPPEYIELLKHELGIE